jgi:two-component system cell cycle response regulator
MSQEEDFAKGFIKGFEEGLKDAWEEIIKLSMKGYTSRELQIMAKTKKSMLFQRVQQKTDEMEKALGRKILTQDAAPKPAPAQAELRPGWSYVIKEERPEKSFSMFTSLIGGGARGLCISRTHPDMLKQKYGFEAEAIWLTKTETAQGPSGSKGAEFVSPNNLAHLASAIREFLSKGENGAVVIEGLEYLTTQNDFKSVLRFVQLINEQVVLDKGYLIIPVDEGTMDPKDFSLVEREMSQVL